MERISGQQKRNWISQVNWDVNLFWERSWSQPGKKKKVNIVEMYWAMGENCMGWDHIDRDEMVQGLLGHAEGFWFYFICKENSLEGFHQGNNVIWSAFLKAHSHFCMECRIFGVRMMGGQAGGDFSSASERWWWLDHCNKEWKEMVRARIYF